MKNKEGNERTRKKKENSPAPSSIFALNKGKKKGLGGKEEGDPGPTSLINPEVGRGKKNGGGGSATLVLF